MREDHEHKGSRIILILFPIFFIFLSFFFFWVLKQNVNAFSCELSNCQLQVLVLLLLLLLQRLLLLLPLLLRQATRFIGRASAEDLKMIMSNRK